MEGLGIALLIIFTLTALFTLIYSIIRDVRLIKSPHPKTIAWFKELRILTILAIFNGLSLFFMTLGVVLWHHVPLLSYEWALSFFGGLLFGFFFLSFIDSFILHYYQKEMPKILNNRLFKIMLSSLPLALIFLFVFSDGFANYLSYPLPCGISFTKGFVTSNPNIAFYAVFILTGAVIAYFICDHRFYIEYGEHGLVESTFLVSLPAGIIGARIAYVIGEWNTTFYPAICRGEWWKMFAIWEGGLTILGGAIAGSLAAFLWFKWRRPNYSLTLAMDIIVPTMLVAQALGRWGNFFNREVYGFTVSEDYFRWLPTIIFNQLHYSNSGALLPPNMVVVPLFLIESITNLLGYFVLVYIIGKVFHLHSEIGDVAFGYLIWYGLTRVIMEPLRDSSFNMGDKGYWSWFWSLIFVFAGALCIVINHLLRDYLRKKKNSLVVMDNWFKVNLIGGGASLITSLILIILGIVTMVSYPFEGKLSLTGFNNGVIFLVIGISLLIFAFIYVPHAYLGYKHLKEYGKI